MQSPDVRKLVENAIGNDWTVSKHHVDLRQALVEPRKITVIERSVGNCDRKFEAWLVLVENRELDKGYRIVMKEDEPLFGLATDGFPEDENLVLCGWYGDLMTAFKGM